MSHLAVSENEVLAYIAASNPPRPMPTSGGPNLHDAAEVYRAAGVAALAQQQHSTWLQYRLQPTDWKGAEQYIAEQLAPSLEQLRTDGTISSWWFLRKYPYWRLRVQAGPAATRQQANRQLIHLLDFAVTSTALQRWTAGRYEPEVVAFGEAVFDDVHAFFHADSSAVLTLVRNSTAPNMPGRRELSLVLCSAMLRSARLDPLERADVWNRVTQQRPLTPEPNPHQLASTAARLQRLTQLDTTNAPGSLFAAGQQLDSTAPWAAAYRTIGQRLAEADESGVLDRGLRATLATLVLHSWNRLGVATPAQGLLARAACLAAKNDTLGSTHTTDRTPVR
ncbi:MULTISPECIES: thiopeptide-type bacteriocin biosynthesis protein [Streptacidiphilus]|uniref:Thiopeptide-type bacteriocin biosynthesis protein n=1 Tax=Streptacidiphilus cavernicola TaxID=3342716 RepID=A0ABV6V0C4_9ACTN|nr:thiopeptide-type bacteriocin biosynthesis protein [Streptacidiphilus jeojiense]